MLCGVDSHGVHCHGAVCLGKGPQRGYVTRTTRRMRSGNNLTLDMVGDGAGELGSTTLSFFRWPLRCSSTLHPPTSPLPSPPPTTCQRWMLVTYLIEFLCMQVPLVFRPAHFHSALRLRLCDLQICCDLISVFYSLSNTFKKCVCGWG